MAASNATSSRPDDPFDLNRFVYAQQCPIASDELTAGRKESDWMWYKFPQLDFGESLCGKLFGIHSVGEARAYLAHEDLGIRLEMASWRVVQNVRPGEWELTDVFPGVDAEKFWACMTMFSLVEEVEQGETGCFQYMVNKFWAGVLHAPTVAKWQSLPDYVALPAQTAAESEQSEASVGDKALSSNGIADQSQHDNQADSEE